MKQNSNKKYTALFFIILFAIIWVTAAVLNFIYTLRQIETNATSAELEAVAECNAAQTRMIFNQYTQALSAVVKSIERLDDFTSPEALLMLNDIAQNDVFSRLAIVLDTGVTYTSDGYVLNIADLHYIDQIKAGTPFMLDVIESLADQTPAINILVPIQSKDGTYQAALRGAISTATLTEVFEKTFAKSGGY